MQREKERGEERGRGRKEENEGDSCTEIREPCHKNSDMPEKNVYIKCYKLDKLGTRTNNKKMHLKIKQNKIQEVNNSLFFIKK